MIDTDRYGPWAVVAGGSEGVGAAFATELAAAGTNLVLIARKPEPLQETARQARELGAEVRTLALDLLAADAVDRIARETADIEVGLLVYNAGANSYGSEFATGELDRLRAVVDLNITRQLDLVHLFAPAMRERGRGGIVLVGSMSGYMGAPNQSVYSASKAFTNVFAESLWVELEPHGVDVLDLVLGVTRTPAMQRAGLDFDIPGMLVAEPVDVAREGLAHLTDGPVWIAGGNYAAVRKRAEFPRTDRVRAAAEGMRALMRR
ncbi:SDR family NAD(P)-dependent oxidoreductase [Rhodococcus rhodnii]|uniref:Dehydrogenase n=2 Tax=Rhodococcus rhodnii TaxID=38312 RepID=R7WQ82_9NOCA|nr:SDR family NAD(P)-dependent oxidoreductase [Rhodococcus rhodnii]EOM77477.1 dehydrogenase [Rhodococcus rhodnii LMG 5362]TXG90352.1 SDR family NAD(P)-dependent oxidoreductase [Rhodococcus rhodnii]